MARQLANLAGSAQTWGRGQSMKEDRPTRIPALLSLLLLATLPAPARAGTVTGTAAYRERIALPPDAVLEVTLEDVSRADAPAEVIARARVEPRGQVPIPFSIEYDAARIDPGRRYSVRARVVVGEKLLFTSTTVNPVLTGGAGSEVAIQLQGVAVASAAPRTAAPSHPERLGFLVGDWAIEGRAAASPHGPAGAFAGTQRCRPIGAAVACEYEERGSGAKVLRIYAYSEAEKVYTDYGVDGGPEVPTVLSKGRLENGVLIFTGEKPRTHQKYRKVIEPRGPSAYAARSEIKGKDGSWTVLWELVARRAAP
jgi:uncharacterized lipoprotein YbaY